MKEINNNIENYNKERADFVHSISGNVLDTFPFNDEDIKEFKQRISVIENDLSQISNKDLIEQIKEALASLNNTHTNLREIEPDNCYIMNPRIEFKAGDFWIEKDGQIFRVTEIDGQPIEDAVKEKMKMIGGGTKDWKAISAINQLMYSPEPKKTELSVEGKEGRRIIPLDYVERKKIKQELKQEDYVSDELLENNVVYLKVNTWSSKVEVNGKGISELVEKVIKRLENSKALIIDVRQNTGGDSRIASRLAGRFFDQSKKYAEAIIRQGDECEKTEFKIDPQGRYLDMPVVILTGPENLSSCELFILMMKDAGRAVTVGEKTGGGSGSPKTFNIKFDNQEYKLNVATWKIIRNNGTPLENIKTQFLAQVECLLDGLKKLEIPSKIKTV